MRAYRIWGLSLVNHNTEIFVRQQNGSVGFCRGRGGGGIDREVA